MSTDFSKFKASKYILYGICNYFGDVATGHYEAEVLNLNDRFWYTC
jgi:ubiquitin C-terminal hydrolase